MKATMVLTPLALAMAAVLSVSAYAGNEGGWHPPKPNPQSNNKGGATALVVDTQQNYNNKVSNFGTVNNASVSGSIKDASGNVGVNVAAGDNNQQANAAALASADASFVFGTATASTSVLQSGYGNTLNNYSNPNTASLSNSANNVSGNLGVNVAAGNFNQQKNDLAAAVSNGQYSTAGSAASQTSTGNTTVNSANYAYGGTYVSLKLNADGSYKGTSDQIGNVYLDTWEGQTHPGGSNTGHIDVDSQAQGAKDLNHDGGAFAFKEKGDVDLKGTVSGFIPAIVGFKTPVTNNASLSNSLQNVSGNVGVNIAAGGGNQQSNSLSIAAGCSSCPAGGEPWLLILAQGFRRQPEPFPSDTGTGHAHAHPFPAAARRPHRPGGDPRLSRPARRRPGLQAGAEHPRAALRRPGRAEDRFQLRRRGSRDHPGEGLRRPARRAGGDPGHARPRRPGDRPHPGLLHARHEALRRIHGHARAATGSRRRNWNN